MGKKNRTKTFLLPMLGGISNVKLKNKAVKQRIGVFNKNSVYIYKLGGNLLVLLYVT